MVKIKSTFLIPRGFQPSPREVLKKGKILVESPRLAGPVVKFEGKTFLVARGEVFGVNLVKTRKKRRK